jgi:hypothetical protein
LVNSSDDEQRHIEAMEEPAQREPKPTDWGFCAYGDAPPAIGGGMPWFYWFESEKAMLAALREHAAYLNPRPQIDPWKTFSRPSQIVWRQHH